MKDIADNVRKKQKTRNRANVIDAIASKCVLFQ